MTAPYVPFLPCLLALLLVFTCGCATSQSRALARSALQCDQLDTVFPIPLRFAANKSGRLYRGCGRYALIRCMHDIQGSVCVVEDVASESESRLPR